MQEQETISSTAIATLPPAERAAVALGSSNTEKHLRELVAKSAGIVNVIDVDGRTEAHRAGMVLRGARTNITKTGKAAREDAQAFSKAVIALEKTLVDIVQPEEDRVLALRDAFDAKLAAEQAERERKEAERVAAIKARIAAIRAIPAGMAGEPSSEIAAEIEAFRNFFADETFAEFKGEADQAVLATLEALTVLQEKAIAAEAEAARIEADRAELARLQAEMAEQQRLAAEAEAERARVAADNKRQLEEQQAAIIAERNKEVAAMQAQREAFEAEKRAFAEQREAARKAAEALTFPLPVTADGKEVINSLGTYYDHSKIKENGKPLMCNADGSRSVFCDLCDDDEAAPSMDQTVVGLPQPTLIGVDMAAPEEVEAAADKELDANFSALGLAVRNLLDAGCTADQVRELIELELKDEAQKEAA